MAASKHGVAELGRDLRAIEHPPLHERPDEQGDGGVEVDVAPDLAPQLRQLEHGADRPPALVEHGDDEAVEVGVAIAGGHQGREDVGEPALVLGRP